MPVGSHGIYTCGFDYPREVAYHVLRDKFSLPLFSLPSFLSLRSLFIAAEDNSSLLGHSSRFVLSLNHILFSYRDNLDSISYHLFSFFSLIQDPNTPRDNPGPRPDTCCSFLSLAQSNISPKDNQINSLLTAHKNDTHLSSYR